MSSSRREDYKKKSYGRGYDTPASRGASSRSRARDEGRTQSRRTPARPPLRTETKYFDTSFLFTIPKLADWTGTEVTCSNYIQSDGTTVGAYTDAALIPSATGAGYGQVVGSKYNIKKIRVRGMVAASVVSDQADASPNSHVRVCLVLDTQPNGAQGQGEDVFTDMGASTQAHYSFLAMAGGSGGRFRILKEARLTLGPVVTGTDGASTLSEAQMGCEFEFQHVFATPLAVRTKANSSTPTVAALSDVNIFMLAHGAQGLMQLDMYGCSRCYYEDY